MSQHPSDKQRHEEGRPDPEELLKRYSLRDSDLGVPPPTRGEQAAPAANGYQHRRGRLRVYLAAAAGAGKTYAMLNEGHRRESRGTDIVVGYVETHKRSQTQAQLGDLEVIPRKQVTYRGVTLEEMDTEAIIAPHALRQRMKHGNIYPPERVDAALNHFFREGNLTALRELALRRTAEKTEEQLEQFMTDHRIGQARSASERVLVGFDARPHTREVIRTAWRLAHGLHADLIAVFIEPEGYLAFTSKIIRWLKYGQEASKHREAALRRLEEHALLAEDLGAEVIRTKSKDIARTLVEIAQEHQVTQIVLGQPARSHWEERIRGSIINRLLRFRTDINIHLVPRIQDEEG